MTTEIVSIVIENDGQLGKVIIPADRAALMLGLIASVFDDGVIQCVRLDDAWKKVKLAEVNKV